MVSKDTFPLVILHHLVMVCLANSGIFACQPGGRDLEEVGRVVAKSQGVGDVHPQHTMVTRKAFLEVKVATLELLGGGEW
jgi:hypothetical protein